MEIERLTGIREPVIILKTPEFIYEISWDLFTIFQKGTGLYRSFNHPINVTYSNSKLDVPILDKIINLIERLEFLDLDVQIRYLIDHLGGFLVSDTRPLRLPYSVGDSDLDPILQRMMVRFHLGKEGMFWVQSLLKEMSFEVCQMLQAAPSLSSIVHIASLIGMDPIVAFDIFKGVPFYKRIYIDLRDVTLEQVFKTFYVWTQNAKHRNSFSARFPQAQCFVPLARIILVSTILDCDSFFPTEVDDD